MKYRRLENSDTWHSAANCSRLPQGVFFVLETKGDERPATGEMCDECLAKEKSGEFTRIQP